MTMTVAKQVFPEAFYKAGCAGDDTSRKEGRVFLVKMLLAKKVFTVTVALARKVFFVAMFLAKQVFLARHAKSSPGDHVSAKRLLLLTMHLAPQMLLVTMLLARQGSPCDDASREAKKVFQVGFSWRRCFLQDRFWCRCFVQKQVFMVTAFLAGQLCLVPVLFD